MSRRSPHSRKLCFAVLIALTAMWPASHAVALAPPVELISPNAEANGWFGVSVAGVPDVDGDGYTDVLIGAAREDPGSSPTDVGRAYLYSGNTGALLRTFSVGGDANDWYGFAVAGAPDLNGDTFGDVIIGVYRAGASDIGRVYLYSGSTGGIINIVSSTTGNTSNRYGYAVAGVPDTNGDTRGEFLVGAPYDDATPNPATAGRAYLYGITGAATPALRQTFSSPNAQTDGHFGWSVAGIADLDDDGYGDVIVGAKGETITPFTDTGRTYVFSGNTGALLHTLVSPNPENGGAFGWAVASVPDLDDDTYDDVLVSAPAETPTGQPSDAGQAYVFSGKTGGLIHTLAAPTGIGVGSYGSAVTGIADIDGDGAGDFAINQVRGGLYFEAGAVFVYSGATGMLLHPLTSPHPKSQGQFGRALAGLDDTTGDGRGDLLIGANSEDVPTGLPFPLPQTVDSAGRAYVYNLADRDEDGVADDVDNCPDIPNPGQANVDHDAWGDACDAPGDLDHDGDVDWTDYDGFTDCLGGPGQRYGDDKCKQFDFDEDRDVDLFDAAIFWENFTG